MYQIKMRAFETTGMVVNDRLKIFTVPHTIEIICTNDIMELIYSENEYADSIISQKHIEDTIIIALFPNNINIFLS
jgi:hypothetical protein